MTPKTRHARRGTSARSAAREHRGRVGGRVEVVPEPHQHHHQPRRAAPRSGAGPGRRAGWSRRATGRTRSARPCVCRAPAGRRQQQQQPDDHRGHAPRSPAPRGRRTRPSRSAVDDREGASRLSSPAIADQRGEDPAPGGGPPRSAGQPQAVLRLGRPHGRGHGRGGHRARRRRRQRQQAAARRRGHVAGLGPQGREQDDLADRRRAREQHDQPVDADRRGRRWAACRTRARARSRGRRRRPRGRRPPWPAPRPRSARAGRSGRSARCRRCTARSRPRSARSARRRVGSSRWARASGEISRG